MSNEDFEKKAEFIVEQQAHFAAQIGQLEVLVVRFAKATSDRFEINEKRAAELDEKMAALIDAQIRTDESVKQTTEEGKRTEEKLRNLIAVVDRYFSEGRNGRAEG